MSSFERRPARKAATLRVAIASACLAGLLAVSACTVRPLYGDVSSSISPGNDRSLSSVAVKPVETRYGQEVRNHLIFAFNGGASRPAATRYLLDIGVVKTVTDAATIQVASENEPTAGTVLLRSAYTLSEPETGRIIATGNRSAAASFDRPRQEFAGYRAERDAENRAARELAEYLRLAVAQNLERAAAR